MKIKVSVSVPHVSSVEDGKVKGCKEMNDAGGFAKLWMLFKVHCKTPACHWLYCILLSVCGCAFVHESFGSVST